MTRSAERPDAALALVVSAVVLASRLPLLSPVSYGTDPDAWRVVAAGAYLAEAGQYVVSRFPGAPLAEGQAAVLWALGARSPVAFGLVTALWSAFGAAALAVLLRRAGAPRPALAAVAAAFVPVVFAESTTALDLVPSAALGVAAVAAAARGWPGRAGLLVGLAVGFRLTGVVWAVPVAVLVGGRDRAAWAALGRAAGAGVLVALVAWMPVLWTYGTGFLHVSDAEVSLQRLVQRATLEVWGVLGLAALGAGLAALLRARRPAPSGRLGAALASGVVAFGVVFARLPLEPGYLVPVVPLVVGLLALHLRPRAFTVVAALLLAAPFALDLEARAALPDRSVGPRVPLAGAITLTLAGPLVHDAQRRTEDARRAAAWLDAHHALAHEAHVVAGSHLPLLVVTAQRRGRGVPPGLVSTWPRSDDPMQETADARWIPPSVPGSARVWCLPGASAAVPCTPLAWTSP